MKSQFRILGIDDGAFSFEDKKTIVIGVVLRANGYIEGIIRNEIEIDGGEATDLVINMIESTRHKKQIKVVMIDGAALGGFNIVDIEKVYAATEIPVLTITRDPPNFDAIKTALKAHFSDWEKRYNLLIKGELHTIETSYNPIFLKCEGIPIEKAKEIITLSTIRGVIPEPIRIAHLIASGVSRGESYGKA